MSGVLANVDPRTQIAGQNRVEWLLFRLDSKQLFGINVFKLAKTVLERIKHWRSTRAA